MSDPKSEAGTEAFSAIEEEFFRAGDAISAAASGESWSDRETAPLTTGVWSRLFRRTPRPPTEQPSPAPQQRARPATDPHVTDEEWDWQIAIARARHSTSS